VLLTVLPPPRILSIKVQAQQKQISNATVTLDTGGQQLKNLLLIVAGISIPASEIALAISMPIQIIIGPMLILATACLAFYGKQ